MGIIEKIEFKKISLKLSNDIISLNKQVIFTVKNNLREYIKAIDDTKIYNDNVMFLDKDIFQELLNNLDKYNNPFNNIMDNLYILKNIYNAFNWNDCILSIEFIRE